MKKFIALMLALALTLSLGVVAFADNGFSGNSSLEASINTAESYVVTIPANQTVGETAKTGTVAASNVLLQNGKKLVVTMASANGYKMAYEGSEIPYTVKVGATTFSGTAAQNVLVVSAGATSGSATLSFATTSAAIAAATKAGNHTDTLTFACSVANI